MQRRRSSAHTLGDRIAAEKARRHDSGKAAGAGSVPGVRGAGRSRPSHDVPALTRGGGPLKDPAR